MIPQGQEEDSHQKPLDRLLKNSDLYPEQHELIRNDLKSGRIASRRTVLPVSTTVEDPRPEDLASQADLQEDGLEIIGRKALQRGEVAIVTLAGGVGSRWTKGAGVVKSLNPFAKISGSHRNFIEIHLAKTRKTNADFGT
jgi:UDP-N-acetylglucosamine pyrophosphorylase